MEMAAPMAAVPRYRQVELHPAVLDNSTAERRHLGGRAEYAVLYCSVPIALLTALPCCPHPTLPYIGG